MLFHSNGGDGAPALPPSPGEFAERIEREAASRPGRLSFLRGEVARLFPGEELTQLRQDILKSFDVPQWGPWHNEGILMDSHLALIFRRIEEMARGEFAVELPKWLSTRLTSVAQEHGDLLKKYALLHDIEKPNTLLLRREDGSRTQVTWEEWEALVGGSEGVSPQTVAQACVRERISSIGYYRESPAASHGELGAEHLSSLRGPLQIPDVLLFAIAHHETAYSFDRVSAILFERHFGELEHEKRDWVLAASYADSASSLSYAGVPHLKNFVFLANSARNAELVQAIERALMPGGVAASSIDRGKLRGELIALRRSDVAVEGTLEELLPEMRRRAAPSWYDINALTARLSDAVRDGVLSAQQVGRILATFRSDSQTFDVAALIEVRATLGRGNAFVVDALKDSELR